MDGKDFIQLTNSLCKHRLLEHFDSSNSCDSVEEFVGVVGNDNEIDYYRKEVGKKNAEQQVILDKIIESFHTVRKENAENYKNPRKSLYDKFAPDFYVREMRKLSEIGRHIPGWYAGARVIREVSQGNPRMFIQIMNMLFEKARSSRLTPKKQHKVIMNFADSICTSTKSLEKYGPDAFKCLDSIASKISKNTHGEYLVTGGNTFAISFKNDNDFQSAINWLQLAVAHSRIIVDDEAKRSGITKETKMTLCNAYCIKYWITMRNEGVTIIKLGKTDSDEQEKNKIPTNDSLRQISIEEVLDSGENM